MAESIYSHMLSGEARTARMRLRTLVLLRWLAVAGQAAAVAVAALVMEMRLPVELCVLAIMASVAFNIISMQVFPRNARLSDRAAMVSMLFDIAQVSMLLMLTGGLTNPFVPLLLAPVTVSASALRLRSALVVAVAALAAISLLTVWRLPLIFADGNELAAPPIYIFGVWAAMGIGILFMSIYARRVAVENYRMVQALNAAQRALASEQRLTAIGGLAAAAAHELGTPLATIKLVSSELADELADRPDLKEDAELIRDQANRCRDILSDMSQGARADEHVKRAPVTAIVEEAAEPHMNRGARIIIRFEGAPVGETGAAPPEIIRAPEIVHGLRNLVQNAVEFADSTIWIDVRQSEDMLRINIGDDGPGYPADLLDSLGDPYVSSRGRKDKTRGQGEYKGMGLGLFIAKTLLERSGARVTFANTDRSIRRANRGLPLEQRSPTGAVVAVAWPMDRLERIRGRRGPLGGNERFTVDTI